jgi:hypothetical protein
MWVAVGYAYDGVVYRTVNGRTFACRPPRPSSRPPTERQLATRLRFCRAAEYAHSALLNPPARAFYEKMGAALERAAYNVARSDYLQAPVISDIALALYGGRPEDEIIIHADDDTEVVCVDVIIKDMLDRVVERGTAVERSGVWVYEARTIAPAGQPLTIHVMAMDRPGNEVTRTVPWVPDTPSDAWLPPRDTATARRPTPARRDLPVARRATSNGHGAQRCRVIT